MHVLVSAASKYGSTQEIAEVIALTLEREGADVDIVPPGQVDRVDVYDAFVIGSAVYAGHWLQAARTLVKAYAGELEDKPVWLFSSGPLGHPPKPEGDPIDVTEIRDELTINGHAVFAGRLDKSRLSFMERAMVMALHAPEGDHRNWSEIRRFAKDVASELGIGRPGDTGDVAVEDGVEAADRDADTTIDLTEEDAPSREGAARGA